MSAFFGVSQKNAGYKETFTLQKFDVLV